MKTRLRAIRQKDTALTQVQDNLWVLNPTTVLESISWVTSTRIFDYFNRVNGGRLSRSVNDAIDTLGFKHAVLLIDNDFVRGRYLKELVRNHVAAYYMRDFLTEQPYFKQHGARLERALLKDVDVALTNSAYLARYAAQYQPLSYDVGQGCDLTAFRQFNQELPADIQTIKGPIVGYVGALLSSRLDIDLLEAVAERRPDWSIVLVGPPDQAFNNSGLHNYSNVHFLGEKKEDQVPAYVYGFDVCINPQKVNAMTQGNYPRKIDEYLAAGKPVVATTTEAMQLFASHVYLAEGAADYEASIQNALKEHDKDHRSQQRRALAFSHTWEKSVAKMKEYLLTINNRSVIV